MQLVGDDAEDELLQVGVGGESLQALDDGGRRGRAEAVPSAASQG